MDDDTFAVASRSIRNEYETFNCIRPKSKMRTYSILGMEKNGGMLDCRPRQSKMLSLELPKAPSLRMMPHDSGIETGNDSNDSVVTQIENNTSDAAMANCSNNYDLKYCKNDSMQPLFRTNDDNDDINGKNQCQIEEIDQPGSSLSCDATEMNFGKKETLTSSIEMPISSLLPIDAQYEVANKPVGLIALSCRPKKLRRKEQLRTISHNQFPSKMGPPGCCLRRMTAMNRVKMVERALNNGESPNCSDRHGRTPLHIASGRGYTEMVSLLLQWGADAECRDSVGHTPLHLAAITCKIPIVTLLLQAGADPLSAGNDGYNPLQLAESKLRILQSCEGNEMLRIKAEVGDVVNMLLACLKNRQGFSQQIDSLSKVCSRLTLSNTADQIQDEVRDLLSNIDALSFKSQIP